MANEVKGTSVGVHKMPPERTRNKTRGNYPDVNPKMRAILTAGNHSADGLADEKEVGGEDPGCRRCLGPAGS